MTSHEVGIDSLGIAFPRAYLSLEELALARGVEPAKYTEGLGAVSMAVPARDEDTVTLAAEAAARALEEGSIDPKEIGLCIVGTETAVDHSKPVSSFLQGLVGLPSNCRIFEAKHACYGGTAGLMTALDWIRSGSARGRRALVVCSDIARYGLRTPGEPTQGGGSVALVVSERPRVLSIDTDTVGTSSRHVFDFWRPLGSKDAVVDGHYSVTCYLDALGGAYAEHRQLAGGAGGKKLDRAAAIYHVPYPKMARKAHRLVCEVDGIADVDGSFERTVRPGLVAPAQLGNLYTGSLYLALASALAYSVEPLDGRDVSLFSYGSGCCAEYFVGRVQRGAAQFVSTLQKRLAERTRVDVATYEKMFADNERERILEGAEAPQSPSVTKKHPRFVGIHAHRRVYA